MQNYSIDELEQAFGQLLEQFEFIDSGEIPDIDLYMDQVTTFMDRHLAQASRDPENDKILTKTMINNYAKSDLLIPPVRKKYGMDQMILLLFIYYMKSFLSISDIQTVLEPIKERYASKAAGETRISLRDIYQEIYSSLGKNLEELLEQTKAEFEASRNSFADAPEEDREVLQRFDLLCRFCADIYIRKLFVERMIDQMDSSGKS